MYSYVSPFVQGSDPAAADAGGERGHVQVHVPLRRRWNRTLAAYRRAEARVAAFKAAEALLPPERRAYPACEDLEQRFGDLDDRRFAALRRLLRLPAPDLPALALKLDLAVADQAWELPAPKTAWKSSPATRGDWRRAVRVTRDSVVRSSRARRRTHGGSGRGD
jgi:hypothetical protein